MTLAEIRSALALRATEHAKLTRRDALPSGTHPTEFIRWAHAIEEAAIELVREGSLTDLGIRWVDQIAAMRVRYLDVPATDTRPMEIEFDFRFTALADPPDPDDCCAASQ